MEDLARTIGAFGGLFIGLLLAWTWICALLIPIFVFSIARNIKKTRLQLERLNDILDTRLQAEPPTAANRMLT